MGKFRPPQVLHLLSRELRTPKDRGGVPHEQSHKLASRTSSPTCDLDDNAFSPVGRSSNGKQFLRPFDQAPPANRPFLMSSGHLNQRSYRRHWISGAPTTGELFNYSPRPRETTCPSMRWACVWTCAGHVGFKGRKN